jgi:hypothetical protein
MDPGEAARTILAQAPGQELHWTVIWDRALRAGLINPMEDPDARARLQRALTEDARTGLITKVSKGTYRGPDGGSDAEPGGHAG